MARRRERGASRRGGGVPRAFRRPGGVRVHTDRFDSGAQSLRSKAPKILALQAIDEKISLCIQFSTDAHVALHEREALPDDRHRRSFGPRARIPRHAANLAADQRPGDLHRRRRAPRLDLRGLRPHHLRQSAAENSAGVRLVEHHRLLCRDPRRLVLAGRRARRRSGDRQPRPAVRAGADDGRRGGQFGPRRLRLRPRVARRVPRAVRLRHVRAGGQRGLSQRGVRRARERLPLWDRAGRLAARRHAILGAGGLAVA